MSRAVGLVGVVVGPVLGHLRPTWRVSRRPSRWAGAWKRSPQIWTFDGGVALRSTYQPGSVGEPPLEATITGLPSPLPVDQGVGARVSLVAAVRREDQAGRAAAPVVADVAVGLAVDADVLGAVELRCVGHASSSTPRRVGCPHGIPPARPLGTQSVSAQLRHDDVRWQRPQDAVGSTDVDEARRQVDLCLDAGVNLFDTADVYSDGDSEEILGEALRAAATASCSPPRRLGAWATGPNDPGLSAPHLIARCEASLRRLGTDCIDLYQVHSWDGNTPLEETLSARRARAVGQGPLRRLLQLLGLAPHEGARGVRARAGCSATSASRSTTRCRRARPSTSWCRSRSTRASASSSGARSPGGLLSGKFRATRTARRARATRPTWKSRRSRRGALFDVVDVLCEIAEAHQVSAAQVALALAA